MNNSDPFPKYEKLYSGIDKVGESLSEGKREGFKTLLDQSSDPDETTARIVNTTYLKERFKNLPEGWDKGANWGATKRSFAKQSLGIEGRDMTDVELYGAIGEKVKTERETRDLNSDLHGKVIRDATGGELDWLASWKANAGEYSSPEARDRGRRVARAAFHQAHDAMQPFEGLIAQGKQWMEHMTTESLLSKPKAGEGESSLNQRAFFQGRETGKEALVDGLMEISEEDREFVLGVIVAQSMKTVEQDTGAEGDLGAKVGKSLTRGVSNIWRGGVRFGERMLARQTDDPDVERLDVERKLEMALEGTLDPIVAKGIFEKMAVGTAQSLPYMASVTSGLGSVVAMASMAEDARGELVDSGVPEDEAMTIGLASGTIQMGLERVQAKMIFRGKMPFEAQMGKWLSAPVLTKGALVKRMIGIGTVQTAGQNAEEALQFLTTPVLQEIGSWMNDSVPEVDWDETLGRLKEGSVDTALALFPLVLFGTGVATFKDGAAGREYLENRQKMMAVGLSEEYATKVLDAPDLETKREVFMEGFKENVDNQEALAHAESDNRAMYQDVLDGVGAHAERMEDGTYMVVDGDGEIIDIAADADAAAEIINDHKQQGDADSTNTVVDMVEYFESIQEEGSSIEFKPELSKTLQDRIDAGEMTDAEAEGLIDLYVRLGRLDAGTVAGAVAISGENVSRYDAQKKVFEDISTIYATGTPLTVVEEHTEGYLKRRLAEGTVDVSEVAAWRESVEQDGRKDVSERELIEWFSEQAQAYVVGNADESSIPASFRAFLRKMKQYAAAIMEQAARLTELDRAGKLDDGFKTHLARSVGLDESFLDQQARAEAQAQLEESGVELSEWIKGKLPHFATARENGDPLAGDLEAFFKGMKNRQAAGHFFAKKGEQVDLDRVVEAAREAGFNFETPGDMLAALDDSMRGIPVFSEGVEDTQQSFSLTNVNTPEFKAWFGDSKIVDKDGKPLMVYHGTSQDFSAFDKGEQGKNTRQAGGELGFFFTSKSWLAGDYATISGRGGWAKRQTPKGEAIYPLYISVKNPKAFDTVSSFYREADKREGNLEGWRAELIAEGHDGVTVGDDMEEVIAFEPTQIKSATGNRGTFDGTNPDITFSLKPVVRPAFFSKLSQVVGAKLKGKSATPEQIKAALDPKKGSGVKAEEIKWSGVMDVIDRLAADNGGKVPVAELKAYLEAEGKVKFEEVRKGAPEGKERYDHLSLEATKRSLTMSEQREMGDFEKAVAWSPRAAYESYVIPGGENYREVVLTMAPREEKLKTFGIDEAKRLLTSGVKVAGVEDGVGVQRVEFEPESGTSQTGLEQYSEFAALDDVIAHNQRGKPKGYTSSHFSDVPNYVAHSRLNEREDAEGKPGLFIEELQSDRHQEGRKEGYKEGFTGVKEKREDGSWHVELEDGTPKNFRTEEGANYFIDQSKSNQIPDAPFRTEWPLQMFKRALRDAVASGKSWIGWTAGQTQADRYDLSKQVDRIVYNVFDKESETVNLYIYYKGNAGRVADMFEDQVGLARVEELVGKDIVTRIKEGKGTKSHEGRTLSGNDLKVGGEGMKSFYDKMMPKMLGKYVSKIDKAAKVQVGEIEKVNEPGEGLTINEFGESLGHDMTTISEEGRREVIEKFKTAKPQTTAIWKIEITDKMRESVAQVGQPTFSLKPREVFYAGRAEVIRNPTGDDRRALSKEERGGRAYDRYADPEYRTTRDRRGNTYIWRSSLGMHSAIEPEIVRREGVSVSQSNQVPRGLIQEDTPEFKAWFKKSKVVDKEGDPLIVYHVTDTRFTEFDPDKGAMGSAFWFTEDSGKIEADETGAGLRPGRYKRVMEVYLSVQKMAGREEYEKWGYGELQSRGFDGVKLEDDYVVFDPAQIKSATDNRGGFDANNPDITFSLANVNTPDFNAWFGNSAVTDSEGEPKVVYHGTGAKSEEGFAFDYSKIGEQGRSEGQGFYFTDDESIGSGYAYPSGTLLKVYLSIQKPMEIDQKGLSEEELIPLVQRIAEIELANEPELEGDIMNGWLSNFGGAEHAAELISSDTEFLEQLGGIMGSGVDPAYINQAVREVTGFDGVRSDGFSGEGKAGGTIWVAFFPEQVKSINNRGTFDGTNPDITHGLVPLKLAKEIQAKMRERSVSSRVAAGVGEFDLQVQADLADNMYQVVPNKVTIQEALDVVKKLGVAEAKSIVLSNTADYPPSVQVAMGLALMEHFNTSGDIQSAVEIGERVAEMGTELGRGVQAYALLGRILDTPEKAQVFLARQIKKEEKNLREKHEVIDGAAEALADVKAEAWRLFMGWIDEINSVPKRRALRAPVRVEDMPNITFSLRPDIAKSGIVSFVANSVRMSGAEATDKAVRERYGDSINPHIEGIFIEAQKLNMKRNLKKTSAKKKTPKKKKAEKEKKDDRPAVMTPAEVDAALKEIRKNGDKLELQAEMTRIDEHFSGKRMTEAEIDETLAAGRAMGITSTQVDLVGMEGFVELLVQDMVDKLQVKNLNTPTEIRDAMKSLFEKHGLELTVEQMRKAFNEKFKIPTVSSEQHERISELAQNIASTPDLSAERVDATVEMMTYIDSIMEKIDVVDKVWSIWYANILSGYATHFRNMWANFTEQVIGLPLDALRLNPADSISLLGHMIKGAKRGAGLGWKEAWNQLKTGEATNVKSDEGKFQTSSLLERHTFAGGKKNPFNYLKFVSRALRAEDLFAFSTAQEAKARMVAWEMAKGKKLKGEALALEIERLLNNTEEQIGDFQERASREWDNMTDELQAKREQAAWIARRVSELRVMERDATIIERGSEFAARITFNYQPDGVIGVMANGFIDLLSTAQRMDATTPLEKTIKLGLSSPRLIVPFIRIVANVLNRGIDYGGIGLIRGLVPLKASGSIKKGNRIKAKTKDETSMELKRGAFGLMVMTALAIKADPEDEDAQIQIHGGGAGSREKNQALNGVDWMPYSIEFRQADGTSRFVTYKYSPLAIGLSVLGHYHDSARYKKLDEKEAQERLALSLTGIGHVILDQSFLSGAADFLNMFGRDGRVSAQAFWGTVNRTLNPTNVGIPFTNMIRQVARDFDPVKRDRSSIKAALIAGVPVVERFNKPSLDVLGDEMESRFGDWFTRAEEAGTPEARIYKAWAKHNITPTSTWSYKGRMEPDMFYDFQKERGAELKRMLLADDAELLKGLESASFEEAEYKLNLISRYATETARDRVGYIPEKK